jgi:hypothetical protein
MRSVDDRFAPHVGRSGKLCLRPEADVAADRVGGRGSANTGPMEPYEALG